MDYTNSNRGFFQHKDRARQLITFNGLRFGNITPTDIDGFFERANEAFVFYEFKYRDAQMPTGQEMALTRLVDAVRAAGKKAVLFVCSHCVDDCSQDVEAARTIVDRVYFNGEWYTGKGKTLKAYSEAFMRWAVPDFCLGA